MADQLPYVSEVAQRAVIDRHPPPRLGIPFGVVEPLFMLANTAAIMAAAVLGSGLYHFAAADPFGDLGVQLGLGGLASVAFGFIAHHLGLYRIHVLLEMRQNRHVLLSWALTLLITGLILFMTKSAVMTSRGAAVCFAALGLTGLLVLRRGASSSLRSALMSGMIRGRRTVVIGRPAELVRMTRQDLLAKYGLDEVERIVLPRNDLKARAAECPGPDAEAVLRAIRQHAAEEIIIAVSWFDLPSFESFLKQLRAVPLPVRLLPDSAVRAVLHRQSASPRCPPIIDIQRSPMSRVEAGTKRLMDILVAGTSLLFLLPLLGLAAIAVKLDSRGPVIFRQRRRGFNGRDFVIYKFRTMTVQEDGNAVVQARRADPRVTRVGRLLRESSIDELPQLWNVLQGSMSLVGPRPHALVHDYEYGRMIANYAFRHHVKPGITGWAQVNGFRGATPRLELMQQRIQHDLWYIDNWCLSLDILIIVKTMLEPFKRNNAY